MRTEFNPLKIANDIAEAIINHCKRRGYAINDEDYTNHGAVEFIRLDTKFNTNFAPIFNNAQQCVEFSDENNHVFEVSFSNIENGMLAFEDYVEIELGYVY